MASSEQEHSTPHARPFWSGVVAFGLVSLPVSLFPANRGKSFALNMVDEQGGPLRRRYFCEQEGTLLERDDIVRGFPVEKDRYVVVEDEELEALAPEKTREIDLRRFVPLKDVNPVFFERGYFLAPDSGATKAYRLLAKSMEEEQRVGIATFVMRDREYIIAIIAEGGILRAETLRFHDEIRTPKQVGLAPLEPADKKRVRQMLSAIDACSEAHLEPGILVEQEVARARNLVEKKLAEGADVFAAPEHSADAEEPNVVDLMQVLKERLQGKPTSITALKRDELYERAQQLHINGRSKMTKDELIEAVKNAG